MQTDKQRPYIISSTFVKIHMSGTSLLLMTSCLSDVSVATERFLSSQAALAGCVKKGPKDNTEIRLLLSRFCGRL